MKYPRSGGGYPDNKAATELVARNLAEIGIDLVLKDAEPGTFIANILLPGNYEMAFSMSGPYDEPDQPLAIYRTRNVTFVGGGNYTDPTLDRLIDAQAVAFDEEKRQQIVQEAQRLIIKEHGPQITLPSGYQHHARWAYVHYPNEEGESPKGGPAGSDIWTELR